MVYLTNKYFDNHVMKIRRVIYASKVAKPLKVPNSTNDHILVYPHMYSCSNLIGIIMFKMLYYILG